MQQPDEPPRSNPADGGATTNEDPPTPTPTTTPTPSRGLSRSRVGEAWIGLILGAIVLILLLIFVAQNGQAARISFLGAQGHLPLGVALLLAAVAGALIIAVPGTVRILQLRRAARRRLADQAGTTPPAGDASST